MPRYFFHLEHVRVVQDPEGSEHADLEAAKVHAVKTLAGALADEPQTFLGRGRFSDECLRPRWPGSLRNRNVRDNGASWRAAAAQPKLGWDKRAAERTLPAP
jgi:hypothetical protein